MEICNIYKVDKAKNYSRINKSKIYEIILVLNRNKKNLIYILNSHTYWSFNGLREILQMLFKKQTGKN